MGLIKMTQVCQLLSGSDSVCPRVSQVTGRQVFIGSLVEEPLSLLSVSTGTDHSDQPTGGQSGVVWGRYNKPR